MDDADTFSDAALTNELFSSLLRIGQEGKGGRTKTDLAAACCPTVCPHGGGDGGVRHLYDIAFWAQIK